MHSVEINPEKILSVSAYSINIQNRKSEPAKLYAAPFISEVRKGSNQIIVSYRSPMNVYETEYGYFAKSRWVSSFRYELWPLNEWKLADAFILELNVSIKQKKPDWFFDIFSNPSIIQIKEQKLKESEPPAKLKNTKCRQETERYFCEVKFGKSFPDTVYLQMGDDSEVIRSP